jgi:hypothetical protein
MLQENRHPAPKGQHIGWEGVKNRTFPKTRCRIRFCSFGVDIETKLEGNIMTYILRWPNGRYIVKTGGMNLDSADPSFATQFATKEDADSAKPGHAVTMGGSGYVGAICNRDSEILDYERRQGCDHQRR